MQHPNEALAPLPGWRLIFARNPDTTPEVDPAGTATVSGRSAGIRCPSLIRPPAEFRALSLKRIRSLAAMSAGVGASSTGTTVE